MLLVELEPTWAEDQLHFSEFEIRFHLAPAAMRLPHHGLKRGIGEDEPGSVCGASLRGHCRIARWLVISACVGRVRVPLCGPSTEAQVRISRGWFVARRGTKRGRR